MMWMVEVGLCQTATFPLAMCHLKIRSSCSQGQRRILHNPEDLLCLRPLLTRLLSLWGQGGKTSFGCSSIWCWCWTDSRHLLFSFASCTFIFFFFFFFFYVLVIRVTDWPKKGRKMRKKGKGKWLVLNPDDIRNTTKWKKSHAPVTGFARVILPVLLLLDHVVLLPLPGCQIVWCQRGPYRVQTEPAIRRPAGEQSPKVAPRIQGQGARPLEQGTMLGASQGDTVLGIMAVLPHTSSTSSRRMHTSFSYFLVSQSANPPVILNLNYKARWVHRFIAYNK